MQIKGFSSRFSTSEIPISSLEDSKQLESVQLTMSPESLSDGRLHRFVQLNGHIDISFDLVVLSNGSELKGMELIGDRVTSFAVLPILLPGTDRFTCRDHLLAIQQVVNYCPNLTYFSFLHLGESTTAKMALVPLFADKERASKLKTLGLKGDYDEGILNLIFENCTKIDSLWISHCPQLRDHHLIEWARRGVRLSMLKLHRCGNVTDDGLIPVLLNSGNKLAVCDLDLRQRQITDRSYRILIDACRYVRGIKIPKALKKLAESKLFYKVDA